MARAFERRGYLSQVENYCWPENFLWIFLQKKKIVVVASRVWRHLVFIS